MIKAFWDSIFAYGDRMHREGKMTELKICRDIEDMLHRAYTKSLALRVPKDKPKPKSIMESLCFMIPGVTVYEDFDGERILTFKQLSYTSPSALLVTFIDDYKDTKNNPRAAQKTISELKKQLKKEEGMKIYISAPISGTSDYIERFEKAERSIEAKGHEAINPCKMNAILKPETTSWEQYMMADLGLLRACNAICVLDNWERSKGCRMEVAEAKKNGMKIYKGLDTIPH